MPSSYTGYLGWLTLTQINLATGNPTGVVKPNVATDPDYIAPIFDDITCSPVVLPTITPTPTITLTPTPTPTTPISVSSGLKFNGLTQHVDIPYLTVLDPCESIKPFTVFVDFYQTSGLKLLHNQLPSTGSYKGFFVNVKPFEVDFGMSSLTSVRTVSYPMWNTRRKLAIVADTSTMQWHCYIEGVLQGSFPYDFTSPQTCDSFQLGGYFRDSVIQQFVGTIFDFKYYDAALSAAEIADLNANLPISQTPKLNIPFTNGVGYTATDISSNSYNGTLAGYISSEVSLGPTNHWVDESNNPIQ